MTLQQIQEALLGQLGLLVALIFILWAGSKGIWVFGWYAKELRDRNTKLENRIDKAVGIADNATTLATKAADIAEQKTEVSTSVST